MLNDEELSEAFASIDLCLINQTGTMNSGTALLSLSLNRPVIAPVAGSLSELKSMAGDEWVKLFKPPLTPEKFRLMLDLARTDKRAPTCGAMNQLDPMHLSRVMLNAFQNALRDKNAAAADTSLR
jgi:hypothetical protein